MALVLLVLELPALLAWLFLVALAQVCGAVILAVIVAALVAYVVRRWIGD